MSLAGKFSFAAQVLPGARPFLRRIIDSFRGQARSAWLRVSKAFRCDLRSWLGFIDAWNGRQAWRDERKQFEFIEPRLRRHSAYPIGLMPSAQKQAYSAR